MRGNNMALPTNYQEARNAFDQQQAQMYPLGMSGAQVIGNDQFGQQFGMASQANAFNDFYNQNYGNTTMNSLAAVPKTNNYSMSNSSVPTPNISGQTSQTNMTPTTTNNTLNFQPSLGAPNMLDNPLSSIPIQTGVQGALPTNLGATPGSDAGGSFTQGAPLPNITTTNMTATSTPQFYTDYLNQIAKQGGAVAQGAQFAGVQPLQADAFNRVKQNVGNYLPTLQQAQNLASNVGNSNIVDALGNLNKNNIATSLAPQATSGIVGSGQFGSTRGAQALGEVINTANIQTQAQQAEAMQRDYQNKLLAAQTLGNLSNQEQAAGLTDTNALATLGGQQQTIAQNQQLFPMEMLTKQAQLMKGLQIPTAVSQSYTGPIPGAYQNSPLSQLAGITAGIAGTGLGETLFGTAAKAGVPATAGALADFASKGYNYIVGSRVNPYADLGLTPDDINRPLPEGGYDLSYLDDLDAMDQSYYDPYDYYDF
jgi:hypothetical protein